MIATIPLVTADTTVASDLITFSYIRVPAKILKNAVPAAYLPSGIEGKHSVVFVLNMATGKGTIQVDSFPAKRAAWEAIIVSQRQLSYDVDTFGNLI